MENVKLNQGWDNLFHLNFPQVTTSVTPNVTPVVSDIVKTGETSTEPVSTSGGKNGKMGKTILITAGLCLLIYGGYRWHIYYQAKKEKQV
jgi:hypothetical protein